jgi:hypothetical protein
MPSSLTVRVARQKTLDMNDGVWHKFLYHFRENNYSHCLINSWYHPHGHKTSMKLELQIYKIVGSKSVEIEVAEFSMSIILLWSTSVVGWLGYLEYSSINFPCFKKYCIWVFLIILRKDRVANSRFQPRSCGHVTLRFLSHSTCVSKSLLLCVPT